MFDCATFSHTARAHAKRMRGRRAFSCTAALAALASAAAEAASSLDGLVGLYLGACPPGWSELSALEGRLALLVNNSFQAGDAAGWALGDGEDRSHTHLLSGQFSFPSKHVASVGGLNVKGAKSGPQPALGFLNSTAPAPSGYPFLQLTPCRYNTLSLQPAPVLPPGGLALFDPSTATAGCPAGFDPVDPAAAGRILAVAAAAAAANGSGTVSAPWQPLGNPSPLAPGQDVGHAHSYTATLTLGETDFVGIDGCCDNDPTSDGDKTGSFVSGDSPTSLPTLSILACAANASSPVTPAVPAGFVLLVPVPPTPTSPICPPGWVPLPSAVAGRVAVGTPAFGLPNRTFGGPPLPPLPLPASPAAWPGPVHTHAYVFSVETTPAGIGLDSGCCAKGYGASGTFGVGGDLEAALDGGMAQTLPLALMPACVQG
jgi:hypothetical protein